VAALDVARLRAASNVPHELVPTSDGKTLFLRHWGPASPGAAAILVLHGITAYSEPYGTLVAEELARAGFPVFGLDLRGHGLSDGRRGDYPGPDRLANDLGETVAFLNARFPRVVVLGHSLGVVCAMIAANRFPERVRGLVLLSAGRQVTPGAYRKPPARVVLKTLFALTLFPRSRLIEYDRPGMLGRGDPRFNFRYTSRFYSSIYGMSTWSVVENLRKNVVDSPNLTARGIEAIPVFVGVGDQDEIFSVESSRAFCDSLACRQKEFVVIPGGRHAAFPPGSWAPLIAWLMSHFPPGSGGRPELPSSGMR